MKIAVTSQHESMDSPLDARFGRARCFCIFDLESEEGEFISNQQSIDSPKGAGIQAAQTVADSKVTAVITGHCGPKAHRALTAAGITVYSSTETTVADALRKFKDGKLVPINEPNAEAHRL